MVEKGVPGEKKTLGKECNKANREKEEGSDQEKEWTFFIKEKIRNKGRTSEVDAVVVGRKNEVEGSRVWVG